MPYESMQDYACQGATNPTLLTFADLYLFELPDEWWTYSTSIESLDLHNCMLKDVGTAKFAEELRFVPNLRNLWFQKNYIGDVGAIALSHGLKHVPLLEQLVLSRNSFKDEGTIALANALHHVPHLRRLVLNDSACGLHAAREIISNLKYLPQLEWLCLAHDPELESTLIEARQLFPHVKINE